MSRLKRYVHSVASGYVLLGVNTLYTLASVPLALHYLSKPEFGLWALVTQVTSYILLMDFGMGGAVSRILIDYKDHREDGRYGSVVRTALWVGGVQGVLVVGAGLGLAVLAGPLLKVPADLQRDFVLLMAWQSVLQGLLFASRVLPTLLIAHQRLDLVNLAQAVVFSVNFAVLWACFALGWGVFSVLWAQAAGQVLLTLVYGWHCARLRLFPAAGQWGPANWARFREVFALGTDVFLYAVGGLLIGASQTLLLTRELGLETAAIWSVCTRAYLLVAQMLARIFDSAYAALSEMLVRGETALLQGRFRALVMLSSSLGLAASVLFACLNQPFVRLWTNGQIGWPPLNDLLLALCLAVGVIARVHIGLVGVLKDFRFLRFLLLGEGGCFIALSLLTLRHGGVAAMLGASLLCSLLWSMPYGFLRTCGYFRLRLAEVLGWSGPALRLGLFLAPLSLAVWWATKLLPLWASLLLRGLLLGAAALGLGWRFGVDSPLRAELLERLTILPGSLRRFLAAHPRS